MSRQTLSFELPIHIFSVCPPHKPPIPIQLARAMLGTPFSQPTLPRAYHVLEGVNCGQAAMDDPLRPTWLAVREAVYGSVYLGGQIDAALLASLVDFFRRADPLGVGIGCWPDAPLNGLLPPNPDYDGYTLYFTQRSRAVDLDALIQALPPGVALLPRDADLLAQSFDHDSNLAAFGSLENTLRRTLGMVVVEGGRVVCEAASGAPTHGCIEVGVTTAEAWRQRGLAGAACASLIQRCEAQGYSTWWDCAKQNTPSVRLAHKLGYENEREYRYVWWAQAPNSGRDGG